jgi:ureidoacrylate peracid hydrolase
MARIEPMKEIKDILNPDHTALIIVDMQNEFCSPYGLFAKAGRDISSCAAIIPRIKKLLELTREMNIFHVQLRQVSLPGNLSDNDAWLAFKTRDGKSPNYTMLGTQGIEIVDELKPLPGEVCVDKFRPSGFHGTFLDQILRANGIRSVLLCGCTTEGCLMSTVLDASFHDYYTCIVEDAVASSVPLMNETALAFMKTRYKMFKTGDIIDLWKGFK